MASRRLAFLMALMAATGAVPRAAESVSPLVHPDVNRTGMFGWR